MSRAQAFRCHKLFSEGRTLVEEEQRSGWPSTTRRADKAARVREFARSDLRLTARLIADELHVNRKAVRLILAEELGMSKIYAKMVSKNLTEPQWDARLRAGFDIQMHYGDAAVSLLT